MVIVFISTNICVSEAQGRGKNPASNETKRGRGFEGEARQCELMMCHQQGVGRGGVALMRRYGNQTKDLISSCPGHQS